jgi:hypothetical protein
MKIIGLSFVRSADRVGSLSWDTPLAVAGNEGASLLEHTVRALGQMPYMDEVRVLTDDEELAARGTVAGAEVGRLPDWFFAYAIPFFSKEQWLLMRAMQALRDAGSMGEVLLVADWRTPLVTPRTLETLYHKLMDDRVAARSVGIYPLDPNLFLRTGETTFFPAWADIGADRQVIPQLYRNLCVGAVRPDRLVMPSPETRGVRVSREEGLRISDADALELAQFYIRRRGANPAPARA